MAQRKLSVELTDDEREYLEGFLRGGVNSARRITRARVLLHADAGWSGVDTCKALGVSPATVCNIKRRYLDEGLQSALEERPRPGRPPKLDDRGEAQLVATASSTPPDGHERWTTRLLADKVVEMGLADSFSYEAVRQRLKKTNSNRGSRRNGAHRS